MSPLENPVESEKTPPSEASAAQEALTEQEIDLEVLAEKVYALLKYELRIERERLGRNRP